MKIKRLSALTALLFVAALAGCSPRPLDQLKAMIEELLMPQQAQSLLATGIQQYEEGDYADAAATLNAALNEGLPQAQRVNAHKHLAFIYCTADLEPACRAEFRKALNVDPKMVLDAAEAGHPSWGPVFQHVRADLKSGSYRQ